MTKKQYAEAEKTYRRVLAIDEKAYGLVNLEVATDLEVLSSALLAQKKYKAAEDVQYRLMTVLFEIVGKQHWRSIYATGGLARIYSLQDRNDEAEALLLEHSSTLARSLGEDHPVVASTKETIAYIYAVTGRMREAEAECRKALLIFAADEKRNGAATMAGARAFETYSEIMKMMGYGTDQVRSRIELIRKGGNPGEPAPVQARANPRKVT
jgi:hypothetical protein